MSDRITKLKLEAEKIRRNVVESIFSAGTGHPGGSLSIAEILAVLYFDHMRIDSANPRWAERDRLVLSKGHAAPAAYAVLAQRGYFPETQLATLRHIHSPLQGHPDMNKVPGVDMSTGSLGQGLSAANGMALSAKYHKQDYRVYVIVGDGEMQEGQIWEAAMTAPHYKLDNLVAFIDNNNLQIDGTVAEVKSVYPIADKFEAFGWHVLTIDGHRIEDILDALAKARTVQGKPVCILAKTVKGKGVSFMENEVGWHGMAPNQEQRDTAVAEIEQRIKELEML